MLSQKLSNAALAIETSADPMVRARRVAELRDVAALWEHSHEGLRRGSPELGLPGHNSPETDRLFSEIEQQFQIMLAATRELVELETNGSKDSARHTSLLPIIERILTAEPLFLTGMERIVNQYQHESEASLAHLQRTQYLLLATILIVLLLEAVLIFRPATRKIDQSITTLVEATDARTKGRAGQFASNDSGRGQPIHDSRRSASDFSRQRLRPHWLAYW
ncbi:MAG: hypothetical protein ACR2H4_13595 [Pyrinomonadaceae bacterium]